MQRRVYVQWQLNSTCPLNSTNIDLSQIKTIPLAAAIAIRADATPPLTFFKYNCTFQTKSSPSRTCLPRFLVGGSERSSLSLIARTVAKEVLMVWLSFLKKHELLLLHHDDKRISLFQHRRLGCIYRLYSDIMQYLNLMQEISIHGLIIMYLNVATDDLYQKIT